MTQEVMELFNVLESNRPRDVDAIKGEFSAMFGSVRDPWLVNGLVNYHMRTGSVRAVDILVRSPEHHARYLFDKLAEAIRGDGRKLALSLLGHVVRRQPLWLHQIASHQIMPLLFKLLRTEKDIVMLMNALLALITLLPMIPVLAGKHFQDIFEVFKRLAAWDNAHAVDEKDAGRREHLQLGLYGLFYNLYGMYPCNFIDFLRQEYGRDSSEREKREIFNHTVKPMLETVRLHPLLVTASKHQETQGSRWEKMEHHDILVECRRLSLEGSERQRAIDNEENRFRSRCGTDVASLAATHHIEPGKASTSAPNLTEAQTQMKTTLTTSQVEPNSILYISKKCESVEPGSDRWFSLIDGCDTGAAPSAPHTPLPISGGGYAEGPSSRTPLAHLHVAVLDGGSPPEAAIEATPENTPIKDLRPRFNFPNNSAAVRSIGSGLQHLPSHIVPSQSQPPSPLKKEPSPFGRVSEMSEGTEARKDRLTRVVLERAQAETSVVKPSGGSPHKKPYPYQSHVRVGSSVPNSPIPIGTGAPASGSTDWPLAHPKPKKDGVTLETSLRDYSTDSNKEDREVTELTMRSPSIVRDDSRTPADTPDSRQQGRGYSEPYVEEWGDDELVCESEEHCRVRNHGLHMPQSSSMLDFAKKVATRIRFYSQCVPDPSCGSFPKSAAAEVRDTLSKEGKLMRVSSCPDFRKKNCKTSEAETQTVDTWPSAYEFFLSDMFQGFCERPAKKRPDFAPESERLPSFSLFEQLDKYTESLYVCRSPVDPRMDRHRLEKLDEQLQLTHVQLLYERHRKDVHAVRNRRLLGKCRKNRATEEQNIALTERVKALQRENEELRAQNNKQGGYIQAMEAATRQSAQTMQEKLVTLETDLNEEKRAREKLGADFEDLRKKSADESADVQHLNAVVFDLMRQLERALKTSEASERLSDYVRVLQRELLMCGEREARIADAVAASPLANHIYLSKLVKQYKEELSGAQDALNLSAAKLEVSQAREAALESAVTTKESVIQDLKKIKRLITDEFDARLSSVEDKYKCLKRINQAMECRILELLRFAPGGGGGGGGVAPVASPHSSPLSASLASSEGPLAAHVALSDVAHLHHLLERPGARDPGASHNNTGRHAP